MLETNIRIILPGNKLFINVKKAKVRGQELSSDLLEKCCSKLQNRHHLAAIPFFDQTTPCLLVASTKKIPRDIIRENDYEIEFEDSKQKSERLYLIDSDNIKRITKLITRKFRIKLQNQKDKFWSIKGQPRRWYEITPFINEKGISAFRGYHFSVLYIENEGVGISVDVITAFFTSETIEYYFKTDIPENKQHARKNLFLKYTERQKGKKGTLLYDNSKTKTKCYLETEPNGTTCETTGKFRVNNQNYNNLFEYYQDNCPALNVDKDALAVKVSFTYNSKPCWVAANKLKIRVMNNSLPSRLSKVDKIAPKERKDMLKNYWEKLGPKPLGLDFPGIKKGFWRPKNNQQFQITFPNIEFGHGKVLNPPDKNEIIPIKNNFKDRFKLLKKCGCFSIPNLFPRIINIAYPSDIDSKIIEKLKEDSVNIIQPFIKGNNCYIQGVNPIPYNSITDAVCKLNNISSKEEFVIFILNDNPISYHEIAYQLNGWRIKRITRKTLENQYRYLTNGVWDRRKQKNSLEKGKRKWQDFLNYTILDILQLLDVIPFRVQKTGDSEGQLFIDVSHDRRYWGLCLLINRNNKEPNFILESKVFNKTASSQQEINHIILKDEIIKLFKELFSQNHIPLSSLLIIRDGKICGNESKGINSACNELINVNIITENALIEIINFNKESQKNIRFWQITENNDIFNPLEGTILKLNEKELVIAATGEATLPQGSAKPYVIKSNGNCMDILKAGKSVYLSTHFNWSNPTKAQKFPIYRWHSLKFPHFCSDKFPLSFANNF